MSTNDNGLTAFDSQPAKTTFQSTINFIAICAKAKGAVTGFYLDRGIGADTILMIVLALVYGGWRAFQ